MRTLPAEFVAERNRLVKQLRADGDKGRATAIAGLRRPRLTDWALNVLAAEHAEEVGAFAVAASGLLDAQAAIIEGREGANLRLATRELREHVAQVARLAESVAARAGRTPEAFLAEVTAQLSELAANPAGVALLREGLLGSEDPGASDVFAGLEPAERPEPEGIAATSRPTGRRSDRRRGDRTGTPTAATATATGTGKGRPRTAGADEVGDADTTEARKRAIDDAERAHASADAARADAERAVARLTAAVERARRQVEDAQSRLDAAGAKLVESEAALGAAERELMERLAEVDAADAALRDARAR